MSPEVGHELGVPIGDNINRTAVQAEDILREQPSNLLGTIRSVTGNVMPKFRHAVNDNEYGVVPLTPWQIRDKVHCDVIP